ncbi:hypothetical protein HHK36_012708 [Tetracentron sinense]|uniref:AAA+ ATPase domain-containing protein n=1 Tax=Tetracentron sinense TaxID=13715 RepID=A0A835DIF1_TETSI|nr:hypothetical protein HHK36_012708 [Tetracentron sinense]
MDFVSPIIDIISRLWDCVARRKNYIRGLEENLGSLSSAMGELKNVRNDVKRRIDIAEGQQKMRHRDQVEGWLQMVETMEHEVDVIIQDGYQQISNRCLGGYCPMNCCSSYKVGKRVAKKLTAVAELQNKGDFSDVADRKLPAPVEAMPSRPTVGMDLMFKNVWGYLEDDHVGIVGLYGMGGVGKTTLLKKINNEFLQQGTRDSYVMVIWVVVSKESSVRRVQKDIGERLGLALQEDASQDARARDIFNVLSNKRFVLLLDDIWDRVDLESVGIPHPDGRNKSKVVFTTRSEAVCGRMDAQKKIRIECLLWHEAWDLFQEKVGKDALNAHPEIPELAATVAKECAGLPLALITIGRTMASKKTLQEWNHAITVLRKSAAEFSGMGDEVFPLLKFSYDSLQNDTIRSCFLYCSLFPEDLEIEKEELIQYWIGEGYLDGFDDMSEARNQGHDIIGTLKLACLLESGHNDDGDVKMHDVIRDLALWIACECGRKKDKFLVQARVGLIEAPEVEKWTEAERISLMCNDIMTLTEIPTCPNLLTLLLQRNQLKVVPEGFFNFLPALRVLDLSWTTLRNIPAGITELVELQYLNLSRTGIQTLPGELKKLVKLKYLDVSSTPRLRTIPHKVISEISRLQVLNLYDAYFGDWEVEARGGDGHGASIEELEWLKHLKALGINIKTVHALQRFFNSQKLPRCTNYLCIKECQSLISIPPSPSSSTLGNMKCLEVFDCRNCFDLEDLAISWMVGEGKNCFSSSLERLLLRDLPKLRIIRGGPLPHVCFQNLNFVLIDNCNTLKDLTWLFGTPNLQILRLFNCMGIEEIICGEVAEVEELNTFSRLKSIWFEDLPELKSIYWHALPFPSLVTIEVYRSPKLKKLPLDSNSAKNTLKMIKGSKKWWDELEWEDETIKSTFLPYFELDSL